MTHHRLCPQAAPCTTSEGLPTPHHWNDKVRPTGTPDCNNCRVVCCCVVIASVYDDARAAVATAPVATGGYATKQADLAAIDAAHGGPA